MRQSVPEGRSLYLPSGHTSHPVGAVVFAAALHTATLGTPAYPGAQASVAAQKAFDSDHGRLRVYPTKAVEQLSHSVLVALAAYVPTVHGTQNPRLRSYLLPTPQPTHVMVSSQNWPTSQAPQPLVGVHPLRVVSVDEVQAAGLGEPE